MRSPGYVGRLAASRQRQYGLAQTFLGFGCRKGTHHAVEDLATGFGGLSSTVPHECYVASESFLGVTAWSTLEPGGAETVGRVVALRRCIRA